MLDIKQSLNMALGRCEGITVGLFGIGRTAEALLPLLQKLKDVRLILRDEREKPKLPALSKGSLVFAGERAYDCMVEDILILSPSVRRDKRELVKAEARGTVLSSECELFFSLEPAAIGITGSDGKSTTATLTAAVLRAAGYSAPAVGNIGVPYSAAPGADIHIAELSSFNLSYISPRLLAAAITNITPNHLNWHKSFDEYRQAKLGILEHTERTVLSADDPECLALLRARGADCATSVKLGYSELSKMGLAEHLFTYERGYICRDGRPLSNTSCYRRREEHTLSNMLTAAALTDGRASGEILHSVFSDFRGLPHRCEEIVAPSGISFFNSSIDTSPQRTARTLTSLDRPVKLLLGGRGKGLSYDALTAPISKYATRVAVYGDESVAISHFFASQASLSKIPLGVFRDFDSAFDYLTSELHPGDSVLLSPAATAYGEFRDFEERGEYFRKRALLIKNTDKI